MRSTQQFSITLPNEMADAVRAHVASGDYATESEVIRDGLRALFARERAMEAWLRKDVVASAREFDRAPDRALSVAAVRSRLGAKRTPATTKPRDRT
jgi:antitoxin ParD1/3/4